MQVIDPSTGAPGPDHPPLGPEQIEARLARAARAFEAGRERPFEDRAALLERVATELHARREPLARRMADEMGKPIAQGRAEVEKCAWVCRHYAEHGAAYLAPEAIPTDARRSYVAYRPLGALLAIMPWNFPLWQAFRQAAPALMAGNTVLLKHAENVPGCAQDIEAVFAAAGAPDGVYQNLPILVADVDAVIADRRIAAVTLTGSTRAGRAVAASAGRALKRTVLELGGSDPYLVLEDADLERAAEACVASRLINSGQSCIAAKRFIVVEAVRERFTELVVERTRAAALGDPREESSEVGPQAREDLRAALSAQVEASVARGARVAHGCRVPDRPGWWYPPSVLTDVAPSMPAFDEELFGPVAAIVRAAGEEEAIALANRTSYGLGAAVFTADLERGRRIAETRLRAGSCFVNAYVKSDPRLPFGGIGCSGYGRELGRHGILELTNAKTVYVAESAGS